MSVMFQMSMLMSLQQATLETDTTCERRGSGLESKRKFDGERSPGTESDN